MKKRSIILTSALLIVAFRVSAQTAEDAQVFCAEAARLIGEEDLVGALDEAKWCVESLEQLRQQAVLTLFPDEVKGFKGEELDNQSAMGMTIISREYLQDDDTVSVSLTTGVAGSGLAVLANLGMGGGKKLRVQKHTVMDMSDELGESQYLVQLKSGGVLTISSSSLSAEKLLPFLEEFPIADLDGALQP